MGEQRLRWIGLRGVLRPMITEWPCGPVVENSVGLRRAGSFSVPGDRRGQTGRGRRVRPSRDVSSEPDLSHGPRASTSGPGDRTRRGL